jgi:hypothetical protein
MVFIKDKQVWTLNPMATSSLHCWSFTFCISHAHDLDMLLPDSARPNFKGTPQNDQNDGIHHHGPTSSTGAVLLCPTNIWGLKPYRAKLWSVRVYGLRPGLFSGNLPYWWPNCQLIIKWLVKWIYLHQCFLVRVQCCFCVAGQLRIFGIPCLHSSRQRVSFLTTWSHKSGHFQPSKCDPWQSILEISRRDIVHRL